MTSNRTPWQRVRAWYAWVNDGFVPFRLLWSMGSLLYVIFEIDGWRELGRSITAEGVGRACCGLVYLALWIIGIVAFHMVFSAVFGFDFQIGSLN